MSNRARGRASGGDVALAPGGERPGKGNGIAQADERIFEQMWQAIIEQQLPPGTKLGEEALCGVFGINRPRIRQILQRLAFEQLVDLFPNRGAYVAQVPVDEAREIFATRRVIEPPIIEAVIQNHTKSQLRELQGFIKVEREAQARRDRPAMIRLSGEFHLRIAEIAGNAVLARILKQLVSRTSLIIAMYEVPGQSGCNCNHHEHLVSLVSKGEAQKAAEFMREHLDSVERSLMLDTRPSETIDLQSVFERIAGRP